jgi:hypothetical protein
MPKLKRCHGSSPVGTNLSTPDAHSSNPTFPLPGFRKSRFAGASRVIRRSTGCNAPLRDCGIQSTLQRPRVEWFFGASWGQPQQQWQFQQCWKQRLLVERLSQWKQCVEPQPQLRQRQRQSEQQQPTKRLQCSLRSGRLRKNRPRSALRRGAIGLTTYAVGFVRRCRFGPVAGRSVSSVLRMPSKQAQLLECTRVRTHF